MDFIEKAVQEATARGAEVVNEFSGTMPPADFVNIQKDDEILIPKDYKVLKQTFRNSTNPSEYCVVRLKRKGVEMPLNFFPGIISRNLMEVNKDTKVPTGTRKKSTGDVVELYTKNGPKVNNGIRAIADTGKWFKIEDLTEFYTEDRFNSNGGEPVLNKVAVMNFMK